MKVEQLIYLDYYSTPDTREICHAVKQDLDPKTQQQAIETIASAILASNNLDNTYNPTYLIPTPQHTGSATYTRKIATIIANQTNTHLLDIVKRKPDISLYAQKQNGQTNKTATFYLNGTYPENAKLILIDNVISSGYTYRAINALFNQNLIPITYAVDYTQLKDQKILKLIETIKKNNRI